MNKFDLQIKLNSIATDCFRNIADYDYISARTLYRNDLIQQAYWYSLQAIEKYLKAILLFNGISILKLSHDLIIALKLVQNIKEIEFTLPADVILFIENINNEGANRYLEYPYGFEKISLIKLDKTIWHIRKYCFYLKGNVKLKNKNVELLRFNLNDIKNKKYIEKPFKYKIFNGELEKILEDKKSIKRNQLIWNNRYYGLKEKNKVFIKHLTATYGTPPHFLDESIFEDIKAFVKFSPEVVKYFKKKV